MDDIHKDCPECGSNKRFYHTWRFDFPNGSGPYLVTCIDCKNPYRTTERLKGDLERDTKPGEA
jgi:DNA-directed RNA polymerase subunit M/transcription elongation factor TFIIS